MKGDFLTYVGLSVSPVSGMYTELFSATYVPDQKGSG